MTILTGLMMVLTAHSEIVTALRPAIREAAANNGVDPVLMEAIMRHESANATSSAARKKNNLAGIMGRRGQRRYATKEACEELGIEYICGSFVILMARLLGTAFKPNLVVSYMLVIAHCFYEFCLVFCHCCFVHGTVLSQQSHTVL